MLICMYFAVEILRAEGLFSSTIAYTAAQDYEKIMRNITADWNYIKFLDHKTGEL